MPTRITIMPTPAIFLTVLFLIFNKMAFAQPCVGSITTFPYYQGFETNDGNWVSGGVLSDWAWGTPAKSVITGAGEGTKCWITGGLTKSTYNGEQRSWLISPCFDFTSLKDPEISFKVFWDTEREFDGASLQYTLDNGVNWSFIGKYSPTAITCEAENWYNSHGIFYLYGWQGWAGNNHLYDPAETCAGGGGSINWLDAKHVISELGEQPNVRFRFTFGSGTNCNEFSGFAFDAFQIKEAPANLLSFTTKCNSSNSRKVDFSFNADCITGYTWNFGDPASGAANINSSTHNPTHIFSAPGTYQVTLNANFLYGEPGTASSEIVIIDANPVVAWPGKCADIANATLSVNITGPALPYTYTWNTVPPQVSASINNVGSGNYSVLVEGAAACPATATFHLKGSPLITITTDVKDALCQGANGSISAQAIGGVAPFRYEWNTGANGQVLQNVPGGNYSVLATDDNGCTKEQQAITVGNRNHLVSVDLGADVQACYGQTVYLKPGAFHSYTWQDGSAAPIFKANRPGKYYVEVKDNEGCRGSDTLNIISDCNNIFFPTAISPDRNGINDEFGPIGDLPGIKQYSISIYDRFGNRVFYSTDPYQKWNGQYKKELYGTNSFAWMANFIYKGVRKSPKGTFVLLR